MIPINIQKILFAANALEELVDEIVFLGGCAAALLVDQSAVHAARATEDVDFIVDITTKTELYKFAKKLKEKGFVESPEIICRWERVKEPKIIIDVMPVDSSVLGFTNSWYRLAIDDYHTVVLPDSKRIRAVKPLIFLATKLSSWHGRGQGQIDHKDMEDVIYVLENRAGIALEFYDCENAALKDYLRDQAAELLKSRQFQNFLPGMVAEAGGARIVINALSIMAR